MHARDCNSPRYVGGLTPLQCSRVSRAAAFKQVHPLLFSGAASDLRGCVACVLNYIVGFFLVHLFLLSCHYTALEITPQLRHRWLLAAGCTLMECGTSVPCINVSPRGAQICIGYIILSVCEKFISGLKVNHEKESCTLHRDFLTLDNLYIPVQLTLLIIPESYMLL